MDEEDKSTDALRVWANMHRSKEAKDLLDHLVREKNIDLVIINKQYRHKNTAIWFLDNLARQP